MRSEKVRNLVSFICLVLMVVTLIGGCENNTSSVPAPTQTEAATSPTGTDSSSAPSMTEETFVLDFSDTGSAQGVTYYAGNIFKDLVEERTDGHVTFNLHFEGELFGPPQEIEAVSKGDIAMAGLHHAFAGAISPMIEFLSGVGARGVFKDIDHYWRFIDTPEIYAIVEREIETKFNAKLLWMSPVSNSIIASKTPIHTMEDFEGLLLRTPGTASANAYGLLGAVPVELSSKELYMALERGVIEAADTGTDEIFYKKFYEVTPYLTKDYMIAPPHALVSINLDIWNSMPEEYQNIMLEASAEVEQLSRVFIVNQETELYEALRPLVEEIYLFPVDEVARIVEILYPNTHDTFFANNDPAEAELVWSIMEDTRNE